jgi:iron complex transport system ATP-binding protein
MLKVDNLSNQILKNISFEIKNKNLIILGSNGVGKTTLAKILCGITKNKDIYLNGKNLLDISYKDRPKLINYIPPKLEIFEEYLDVKEFLSLNSLFDDSYIDKVLELFNIGYIKEKNCKFLSSGESQLLLLSGAVLHNALYTILDEPTSNLDPTKLKNVYKLLKDENILQNKIIITHNLDLAYKLGFDILFLEDGQMRFLGSNEEFFSLKNLDDIYNGSVIKRDEHIMVNL